MIETQRDEPRVTSADLQSGEAVPLRRQRIETNDSRRSAKTSERGHCSDLRGLIHARSDYRLIDAAIGRRQAAQPAACSKHGRDRDDVAAAPDCNEDGLSVGWNGVG